MLNKQIFNILISKIGINNVDKRGYRLPPQDLFIGDKPCVPNFYSQRFAA